MSLSDKILKTKGQIIMPLTQLIKADDVREAVMELKEACIERFYKNDKPEGDLDFVMKKIKEIFGENLC